MQSGPFNVTIFDSQDNILYRFNTSFGPTITMVNYY